MAGRLQQVGLGLLPLDDDHGDQVHDGGRADGLIRREAGYQQRPLPAEGQHIAHEVRREAAVQRHLVVRSRHGGLRLQNLNSPG
jgi:hypothetical protein